MPISRYAYVVWCHRNWPRKTSFSPFETSALQLLPTGIRQLLSMHKFPSCRDVDSVCDCLFFWEKQFCNNILLIRNTETWNAFYANSRNDTLWHMFRDANFANCTKFNWYALVLWWTKTEKTNQISRENDTATVM